MYASLGRSTLKNHCMNEIFKYISESCLEILGQKLKKLRLPQLHKTMAEHPPKGSSFTGLWFKDHHACWRIRFWQARSENKIHSETWKKKCPSIDWWPPRVPPMPQNAWRKHTPMAGERCETNFRFQVDCAALSRLSFRTLSASDRELPFIWRTRRGTTSIRCKFCAWLGKPIKLDQTKKSSCFAVETVLEAELFICPSGVRCLLSSHFSHTFFTPHTETLCEKECHEGVEEFRESATTRKCNKIYKRKWEQY